MPDVIDFDAFRAEHVGEPVRLKVGGKIYDLPPSLPAIVALDIIRLQTSLGENANVPPEILHSMGVSVFGEANFLEIVKTNRLTLAELSELLQHVMRAYAGVPAPNREARRKRAKKSSSR